MTTQLRADSHSGVANNNKLTAIVMPDGAGVVARSSTKGTI